MLFIPCLLPWVPEQQTIRWICSTLLKENFKNLLFDLLITGKSFKNLSYLSSTRHWIRPSLHKSSEVVSQYIIRSWSLWHPRSNSMLKINRFFSLVLSKLMSAFSVWLYNLVKPKIISTNTSSKTNSRSLRGITILSSLLNFGMFAHSKTLISRFANFISKTGGLG